MSYGFNISEFDVVYISYDEPNADENYAKLLSTIPWAKRVHGVEGSDAAHKAAASIASTYRFITIDGDNVVDKHFLNQIIVIREEIDTAKVVLSWPGRNIINGLEYGNGGIKCWNRHTVLTMKTHENAPTDNIEAQIDFCWELDYVPIDRSFSDIVINSSPMQAWRAGFREGVKMCLHNGHKVDKLELLSKSNIDRLFTWMLVGTDVSNGIWAILGARQGFYMTMYTDWDYIQVRDFRYLTTLWNDTVKQFSEQDVYNECIKIGDLINSRFLLPEPYTPLQSKFFKKNLENPKRQSEFVFDYEGAYDIFMITYGEPNAEENWNLLKTKFPRAQRIDMVKGIHQAHIAAAMKANTPYLWVVDGDAQVSNNFNFDYIIPPGSSEAVRVWRCVNPVNDLVYGYGGIKLLPRDSTRNMDISKPDMTTSISENYIPIKEISNVTAFNTDEFNTWRSAFRECCKLASSIIDRQKQHETQERLDIWCSVGEDRAFGKYAIDGAKAGKKYGEANKGNVELLSMINDFTWMRQQFKEYYE